MPYDPYDLIYESPTQVTGFSSYVRLRDIYEAWKRQQHFGEDYVSDFLDFANHRYGDDFSITKEEAKAFLVDGTDAIVSADISDNLPAEHSLLVHAAVDVNHANAPAIPASSSLDGVRPLLQERFRVGRSDVPRVSYGMFYTEWYVADTQENREALKLFESQLERGVLSFTPPRNMLPSTTRCFRSSAKSIYGWTSRRTIFLSLMLRGI